MMKKSIVLLFILASSCTSPDPPQTAPSDNQELKALYQQDQADRRSRPIDWKAVSVRDSLREARVYALLDANLVKTAADHANAAMIFQHGKDTIASTMAVKMMKKAVALDSTINKWLLAAAIDRDLMRRKKPQIYGTQYMRQNDGPFYLYDIDTTQVSDAERKAYGVETLAAQREKVRMMNKRQLSDLLETGTGIDEIITLCKTEDKANSSYDLSESSINRFGYQLMHQERPHDALKIFKLNTELYPNAYNTHDSYGECLLTLNRNEEAIRAYKKSLELNPENTHAEKVLAEIDNSLKN